MIKDNPTSAHRFVKCSLFSHNAGKKKKVFTALNLPGDFLLLSVSVSYCLIHQVDLSVFEPQSLLVDSRLPSASQTESRLFQQLRLLIHERNPAVSVYRMHLCLK